MKQILFDVFIFVVCVYPFCAIYLNIRARQRVNQMVLEEKWRNEFVHPETVEEDSTHELIVEK